MAVNGQWFESKNRINTSHDRTADWILYDYYFKERNYIILYFLIPQMFYFVSAECFKTP
jgi:hypothetical protein